MAENPISGYMAAATRSYLKTLPSQSAPRRNTVVGARSAARANNTPAWLNDLINSGQSFVNGSPSANTFTPAAPRQDAFSSALDRETGTSPQRTGKIGEDVEQPRGALKIVDALLQPGYAMIQGAADAAREATDPDNSFLEKVIGTGKNLSPVSMLGKMGTGNRKVSAGDILRGKPIELTEGGEVSIPNAPLAANEGDNLGQKIAKGAGGFAADVALDPISYIPGAAFAKAGNIGKAAATAPVKAAAAAENATVRAAGQAVERGASKAATAAGSAATRAAGTRPGRAVLGALSSTPARMAMAPIATTRELIQRTHGLSAQTLPAATSLADEIVARVGTKMTDTQRDALKVRMQGIEAGAFEAAAGKTPQAAKKAVTEAVESEASNLTKAVKDADSEIKGTFVPKNAEPARTEVKYLEKQGVKSPQRIEYSAEKAALLQKTETGDPMYPGLQKASAESPETSPFNAQVREIVDPEVTPAERQQALQAKETPVEKIANDEAVANVKNMSRDEFFENAPGLSRMSFNSTVGDASVKFSVPAKFAYAIAENNPEAMRSVAEAVRANMAQNLVPVQQARQAIPGLLEEIQTKARMHVLEGTRRFNEAIRNTLPESRVIDGNEAMAVARRNAEKTTIKKLTPDLAEKMAKTSAVSENRVSREVINFELKSPEELAETTKVLQEKYHLSPEDASYLLGGQVKTEDTFKKYAARLKKLQSRKTNGEPVYRVVSEWLEKPAAVDETAAGAALLNDGSVVTAAEQIMDGVAGTKSAADIASDTAFSKLSQESRNALESAVSGKKNKKQWLAKHEDYKFSTDNTGALRDSPTPGEGYAVHNNSVNRSHQANIVQGLIDQLSPAAREAGLRNIRRSEFMKTTVLKGFDEIEDYTASLGAVFTSSAGPEGLPLSFANVIRAMDRNSAGRHFTTGRVFDRFGHEVISGNGRRSFAYEAGKAAAATDFPGSVKPTAVLEGAQIVADTYIKRLPELAGNTKALRRKAANASFVADEADFAFFQERMRKHSITTMVQKDGRWVESAVTDSQADAIIRNMWSALNDPDTVRGLIQSVHNNSARAGIVFGQTTGIISDDAISAIVRDLSDVDTTSRDIAKTLMPENITAKVNDGAKAAKSDGHMVTPRVEAAAEVKVEEALTELATIDEFDSAKYFLDIGKAVERGEKSEVISAMRKQYEQGVSEGFHKQTVEALQDIAGNTETAMNSGLMKIMAPISKKFIPHFDNPTLHSSVVRMGNVGRAYQSAVRQNLVDVMNKFRGPEGKEVIKQGFTGIQKGIPFEGMDEGAAEAARMLSRVMDSTFTVRPKGAVVDPGTPESVFSEWMNKGFEVNHMNQKLKNAGLKFEFDKVLAKSTAENENISFASAISRQWMTWDVDDPIDFLARVNTAMGSLATDAAISQEGWRLASNLGYASTTRRAGFVPMNRDGILGRFLPENAFVDKRIASEFTNMERILSENQKIGQFFSDVMGPLLDKWKAGMTIYNPGHHVRNLVGDTAMSYLINGTKNPKYYHRATRMLTPGNNIRGKYEDFDFLNTMRGVSKQAEGGGFGAKVRIKGKQPVTLTDQEVQIAAMEHGILPDFSIQEDLFTRQAVSGGEGMRNFGDAVENFRPLQGKGRRVAGTVSEARDDWVRLADFMSVLEGSAARRSFASVDDAVEYAAAQVRRAHPDGSDLTAFERGRMKMAFPFYSWTRKALPLVIESIVMQPGRVLQYPKAMYAWGQANGMDLESMSDPFPANELYPSWLRENMAGPTFRDAEGNAIGFRVGVPQDDLMGEFAQNPIEGAVGMLNPMFKAPMELMTGSRMVSEIPINNKTEYAESTIPGLSQFGQLTGYSPLGSAKDILSGEGPRKQDTVVKGNKAAVGEGGTLGFDPIAFTNRLLNVGMRNYDTPSARKSAEFELRDRLRQGGN